MNYLDGKRLRDLDVCSVGLIQYSLDDSIEDVYRGQYPEFAERLRHARQKRSVGPNTLALLATNEPELVRLANYVFDWYHDLSLDDLQTNISGFHEKVVLSRRWAVVLVGICYNNGMEYHRSPYQNLGPGLEPIIFPYHWIETRGTNRSASWCLEKVCGKTFNFPSSEGKF